MNKEESKAYIGVLLCIAKADGVISSDELKYIKTVAPYKGIAVSDVDEMALVIEKEQPQLETLLQNIGSDTSKDLLRSIMVLGYADGCYSEPEKRAYTYISGYFDLEKKEVQRIEQNAIDENDANIEDDSFRDSLKGIDNVIDDRATIIAKSWIWKLDKTDNSTIFGCNVDELIEAWNK